MGFNPGLSPIEPSELGPYFLSGKPVGQVFPAWLPPPIETATGKIISIFLAFGIASAYKYPYQLYLPYRL
jgi:hypothetical protein